MKEQWRSNAAKKYYIKNKDKILEQQKDYHKEYSVKNKDKLNKYQRDRRIKIALENPELKKLNDEKRRAYYLKNREQITARKRAYYLKNKLKKQQEKDLNNESNNRK